ncbi:COP1-interacting protein 7 [Sesamum angolense]|uniref:COP1-interacting protein 7 n=1 Tax=Sesamum angolense TaxID=2727404 RepID=A0AAE1WKX2_9LAMI|nr:COP1-interacting protein 7 [Sesamum angolense]
MMEKMKSDAPLDYAVFQLSPKRSRCELFVSSGGSTEKLASGLLKPFVANLKVAEEQVASAAQSVRLEVGRRKNAEAWFTKGTLERFVRFVSTPEVLELVNTFDAEMSQLEAARRIYSQGAGDQLSDLLIAPGGGGPGVTAADDATKKELLRAIDLRLVAVQQDLTAASARAAAAGFNVDAVSELQIFADRFGAHRLNEACGKFISLCERRPDLINQWKSGPEDRAVRSSCGSDMSIDDDPPSPPPRQEAATCQQPNPAPSTFPLRRTFSRESSVERDDGNKANDAVGEKDGKDETLTPDQTGSTQASQPARRLSVQDRINLFENKQKENSGGKPVVVKSAELRRLPSDVSTMGAAAEKAVLRRWSGASDMSIDLSAEKKDTQSPLSTPSSATVSQENKVLNLNDDTTKSSSVKPDIKVIPSLSRGSDSRLKEGSNKSEQCSEPSKSNSNLLPGESDGLNNQVLGKTQSRSFIIKSDNQENSEEKLRNLVDVKTESASLFGAQGKLKDSQSGEDLSGAQSQIAGVRDQGSSLSHVRRIGSKGGGRVDILNQRQDSEPWDESVVETSLKSTRKAAGESGVIEGVSGSRIREAFAVRYKGIEGDSSSAQQEVRYVGETEVVEKKELRTSEKVSSGSVSGVEDSGPQRMKFSRQGSAAELSKKAKMQGDSYFSGTSRGPFSGKVTAEAMEGCDSFSTPPPEQGQRMTQPKGNQELNDELKMKANELEKLFAEHKLRVPGDQSNPRRGKSEDSQHELGRGLHYSKPVADVSSQLSDNYKSNEPAGSSKNKSKFISASAVKTIDSKNYGDALSKDFSELSVAESSRGKFYDKYIQKRDAKLREDWSSNRAEKEARLKFMQDSLERSRSEMKAKFSGSADRQDSLSSARRRAERLRSYNSRSIMKREQQYLDFNDSEDDEEALDFVEKNHPREDNAFDEISFGDGISKGAQGKKLLSNNRSSSSSTPRTSAAPAPRSSTKTSTNTGKRRLQPDNPLAQSVPNFSDLRKENTKLSSGGSKTTRSQLRNYARSKSATEEATIVKEEKPRRLQAIRKSSVNPRELREMSPLDSDGVGLTPIKFDEEVQRTVGTKPFLKKGSRASFVSQTNWAKGWKGVENNVDENDEMASGPDEFGITVKDEGEEEFETLNTEGHKVLEEVEPIMSLGSEKFVNSGSENGDGTLTFSRVDQALGSQLPSEIPSSFLPVDSTQDWPSESPMSWNSHSQHPFSYSHEMSDVDASVDSPVGSPASWNSHSLNQMETDAARMRKKWGTAQKPMLVAHSSNNLSRKDMTRGFKRLLKFGRKNRGSESLVDWISATTSEGDDDTEDGRDPANRSSEDLRKSRMGFAQAQPSDDSFNESEFFNESVQSSQSSIPAPPGNFKLREDHISGSSIKEIKTVHASLVDFTA